MDARAALHYAIFNKADIELGSAFRFTILVAMGGRPPVGSAAWQAHLTIWWPAKLRHYIISPTSL